RGFVEGAGTYQFDGGTVIDSSTDGTIDVFSVIGGSDNNAVTLSLPVAGFGSIQVTTAGGTSAPVKWNVRNGARASTVVDVAYNAAANEVLVASSGTGRIHRIQPGTGVDIGSYNIPVQNSGIVGLDILAGGLTLHDSASNTDRVIPAGSLMVFNGAPNPDRIVALNATT